MLGNLVQQNLPYLTYGNSISSYQQPTYQYVINPNSVSTNTQRQVVVNPQSTSYTAGSCGTPIQPSMTTTDMVQQRRNEIIQCNVVLFTKKDCKYCKAAKELLCQMGVGFCYLEYDTLPNADAIFYSLSSITGMQTVPQIFICGRLIGGASELTTISLTNGLLYSMIGQCSSRG